MIGGLVVIFGLIGCNFGVGMFGGVVYVYVFDLSKVNVQLFGSGEFWFELFDCVDFEVLWSLLFMYVECIVLLCGFVFLESFEESVFEFVKVFFCDFVVVWSMCEEVLVEGIDFDGDIVWNCILEVIGG